VIPVAITGVGIVCALGNDVAEVRAAVAAGRVAVRKTGDLRDDLPMPGTAASVVDCVPLLRRKRDKKLLPRAAELGMVAAAAALGDDRPPDIGMFLGVGREPPDDPEATDAMLRASQRDRKFDIGLLATVGLPLYPPLTPLRTLPNLALAHVAIHLGFEGEAGTRAGEEAAGIAAIVEGWLAVAEGRADVVIAGGADSRIDPGSVRDLVRLGRLHATRGGGEGAAMLRLEPVERAQARGAAILAVIEGGGIGPSELPADARLDAQIGACGAAAGPIAMVVRLDRPGSLRMVEGTGASAWIAWR
jgi:3-oxoacyl-[acyl-carrier-protein] synthase II